MAAKIIDSLFGGGKKKAAAAPTADPKGPVVTQLGNGNLSQEMRRRLAGRASLPQTRQPAGGIGLVNTTGKLGGA